MRIPRHGDDDGDYTLNEHRGHDDLIWYDDVGNDDEDDDVQDDMVKNGLW